MVIGQDETFSTKDMAGMVTCLNFYSQMSEKEKLYILGIMQGIIFHFSHGEVNK